MITRRHAVAAMLASGVLPCMASAAGEGADFSWDRLKSFALARAHGRFAGLPPANPAAAAIDYDDVGRIAYRGDRTLWPASTHGVRFFPLSRYAASPIAISIVEKGRARPFDFSPDLFAVTPGPGAPRLLPGFSGFRLMAPGGKSDWLAFQGAAYFRAAGALDQYGLSARGLAIDTGSGKAEEFPAFTRFWLEPAGDALTVYALLEGKSVTGAWRFVNRHVAGGVTQDVSCAFALRADVARLGVAPLTSMFWYGEGNRSQAVDWRPEVHDSDGLQMLTGTGERIWRPLGNPPRAITSSFADSGPKGFGLLQRDRAFDHYQDDGVFYEKRPSLWIEPQGDWGKGAVTLYEIPTHSETDDNVVAFWTPAAPARAGATYSFDYRMRWIASEPLVGGGARATDCWTGRAGRPGQTPIANASKLVADFVGPGLGGLSRTSGVEAVVNITHGRVLSAAAYPVAGASNCWRLMVDVALDGPGPVELRAFLRRGTGALTETLLYQLF
ncbi:MAG: glucan biosynthesis protein [Sphingomonadaceae bacterium]|nr:glucan biosynthesis protein [Sphingomonadaceae bacterium]